MPEPNKVATPVVPAKPESQPTLTSKNLPQEPVTRPAHLAEELDDSIVARPLMLPDFVDIKAANPNVKFRWVNFKVQDGHRYAQCQAMGFVNATKEDIKPGTLLTYLKDGGTKLVNGDLILMKLDRKIYLGALKHKDQQAEFLTSRTGHHTVAAQRAAKTLNEEGAGRVVNVGKISVFVPGQAELDRLGSPDK